MTHFSWQYRFVARALMLAVFGATAYLLTPAPASAGFEFGGQASSVIQCVNGVTWTRIGAPRGGDYIWAPGITRTYQYGPPTHSGQWLMGLKGPPFTCLVTIWPVVVFGGITMSMLGSSQ